MAKKPVKKTEPKKAPKTPVSGRNKHRGRS